MIKLVFTPEDLLRHCRELGGGRAFSPGFDKMPPEGALQWLKYNGEKLCAQLNAGKYRVMPACGFYVAKRDGHYRRLARLTAIDRVIQADALEMLSPFCEERFSPFSFAYRRGRGTGSALRQYCEYASQYPFAAKIDPVACFDSIRHDELEKALTGFFSHGKTVSLLMSFAKMPLILDGELTERNGGLLQGAPASGMLCNVYFHALDMALTQRQIPFLRYGDDVVVFASSPDAAKEASGFVRSYMERSLGLRINLSKSRVDASEKLKYLGHGFIRDGSGIIQIGPGEKSASAYYEWNISKPRNHRNSMDILSSGILRQKDYSAIFESDTERYALPLDAIERINIFSSVIFDSGFLEKAMRAGVCVNVFGKNYDFLGRFVPAAPIRNQQLIFEQLIAYNDPAARLELAKQFDLASVHNLRLNIRYYNKQRGNERFEQTLAEINSLYRRMKDCCRYSELLLLEARIRELYYGCFDLFISNPLFSFGVRSRQPPLNEVNSLLSFGNVVLYNYIATELYKSSLDIRVGFLHATNRRKESLNLDIAEIFRPLLVDRVVFAMINRKEIDPGCFDTEENGGVYMNEEGKRLYLRDFYEKLNSTLQIRDRQLSYAMLIDDEIHKLTRRFRNGEEYKAYRQVR
ncbi:MAG: CRISPR-associated endonuclease Cas1 [Clostridia bacterium]|nr:CRISPR-associated endonuclease Cas1 [Clostridia bacterium]